MSREYIQNRSRLRRNRPSQDDAREMEYRVQSEPSDWTEKRGAVYSLLLVLVSLLGFVLFRAAADPIKEFVLLVFIAGNFAWYVPRREAACIVILLVFAAIFDCRMAAYVIAPVCLVTLAQQVVRHEVYLWTAAPTPLRIRDRIRERLETRLRTSARVPILTTVMLILGRAAVEAGNALQNLYLVIGWLTVLITIARVIELGRDGRTMLLERITSFWTYNLRDREFVNVFRSPAGSTAQRIAMAYISVLILSAPLSSPCLLLDDLRSGHVQPLFDDENLPPGELSIGDILVASGFFWSIPNLLWYCLPALVALSAMVLALASAIRTTGRVAKKYGEANTFESTIERLKRATSVGALMLLLTLAVSTGPAGTTDRDPLEVQPTMHLRQPIAIGTDASTGEAIVLELSTFNQGIYLNGPPGTGKTYQLLQLESQFVEQGNRYLRNGDRGVSLIAMDLKADDYLTFHILRDVAERLGIPFKYFTNLTDVLPTYAFNPLDSAHMRTLDPQGKAEFICGATGLLYGREYGRGHFSSVAARVIAFGFEKYPDVRTFRELSHLLNTVLNGPARVYKHELNPEFAKSGIHALTVLGRLARLEQMNVSSRGRHPKLLGDKMIDLSDAFRTPQVCLFHLNSTREMYSAADVGLLAAFEAIHAAASIPPGERVQTYFAIDEFSKLAHSNFAHILEQSRSLGLSTLLANQSLASLQQNGVNLLDAVMTDQRIRWWMAFSNPDEQKWFSERAGERLEVWEDHSVQSNGQRTTNFRKVILPLYPINLIKMAANDEDLSIFELTRRSSNLDLGGFPLLVNRLRLRDIDQWKKFETTPWPTGEPGTFVPKTRQPKADPAYVALAQELEDDLQDAEANSDLPPRPDAD